MAARLAQRPDVGKVVAIDDRRGDVDGVTWRVLDVCDPALAGRFGKVDAIVHLDVDTSVDSRRDERPGRNVRGTQTVITAAAATGVRRVVLVTSAMVYGALPDNPVPLDEDAPLRALPDGSFVSDLLEIERLARRAPLSHPGLSVTVLRPATVVGPGHRQRPDPPLRGAAAAGRARLAAPLAVLPRRRPGLGARAGRARAGRPAWSRSGARAAMEQAEVELVSGMRRIELPSALAFGTAERLHRIGVIPAPASDLQYVVHPGSCPRPGCARPAGGRCTTTRRRSACCSSRSADITRWRSRRVGRRDAAVGAAGAAVAVVGTAALVRRARKKRRG